MSKGRPLKLVKNVEGNRTKKELEERQKVEDKLEGALRPLQKSVPNRYRTKDGEDTELNKLVRLEWNRVHTDLVEMGIRDLDRALVENYCVQYAIYNQLYEKISNEGVSVINRHGEMVENPLIKGLSSASANIKGSAQLLGMTVDSRMKLELQGNELKKEVEEVERVDIMEMSGLKSRRG